MSQAYSLTSLEEVQLLSVKNILHEYANRDILSLAQQQIDIGFNKFVLDLAEMPYTNSIGLNFLIALRARCIEQGGELVLANVSHRVMRLLDITKLNDRFHLSDSVEDAIQQIQLL